MYNIVRVYERREAVEVAHLIPAVCTYLNTFSLRLLWLNMSNGCVSAVCVYYVNNTTAVKFAM